MFNFIDAHSFLQFSFCELRHLGVFDLAEHLVDMEFSNKPFGTVSFAPNQTRSDTELSGILFAGKILNL